MSDEIKPDNDMIRPLNEDHAKELMSFLTAREDLAVKEGIN